MTEASKVKVISPERPELVVTPGIHKPPGSGLIHPVPPSLPIPSTSTLVCRSCTSTGSLADITLVSIMPSAQRTLQ